MIESFLGRDMKETCMEGDKSDNMDHLRTKEDKEG